MKRKMIRNDKRSYSIGDVVDSQARIKSYKKQCSSLPFQSLTKIVGTLGQKSRDVDVIAGLLTAGMSVARFDFSWANYQYHQETFNNLQVAVSASRKYCAVMLETIGAEIRVDNKSENALVFQENDDVLLTPDNTREVSSHVLPINFDGLAKSVQKGDTIFVGNYPLTLAENRLVLEVKEFEENDVVCKIKNFAALGRALFTVHVANAHIDLPTLTDGDKYVIRTWGVRNNIDFLSLSHTRCADDIREARKYLSTFGTLSQTQIFAKIENEKGFTYFDEILQEADGIILSRARLASDLTEQQVWSFQKAAVQKCKMAGKPVVVANVVDSMASNPSATDAEKFVVVNAVSDGTDAILLDAETLRGLHPVKTVSVVSEMCEKAEKGYNTVKYVGEPKSHLESIASSVVQRAIKAKAAAIICFTNSGKIARLIAKYGPTMPVLPVVFFRGRINQSGISIAGVLEAKQTFIVRALFARSAIGKHPDEPTEAWDGDLVKDALVYAKAWEVIHSGDDVVVCLKVGEKYEVKTITVWN